jgi:precorrin-4/cobalt-precorrin-4 C11-methyltransferase
MSDLKHPVYFIGAGPGHVKYLSLEGKEALEECSVVYALEPYPRTFAGLLTGKTVLDPFERSFDEITREVEEAVLLAPAGFLVPGDMTVFSPFQPLVDRFSDRSTVVAGVGIVNAAAALLRQTLDMPEVSNYVVLTSPKHISRVKAAGSLNEVARSSGTLVLYMNNMPLDQLFDELSSGFRPDTPAAIVSRLGMPDERIYSCTLSTMAAEVGEDDIFGFVSGDPSLAIIIIGEVLASRSDPSFWDRRKEKLLNGKRQKGTQAESHD